MNMTSKPFEMNSMSSSISKEFRSSMESLRFQFPAAFNFLSQVENSNEGFAIMTSVNAHFYYKDSYLAHIKPSINSLLFSPKFHVQIAENTIDRHELIFTDVFRRLTKCSSGKEESWVRFNTDDSIDIMKGVPLEFFSNLQSEIIKIHKNKIGT